jgi:ketosteroid isomerase-like protein
MTAQSDKTDENRAFVLKYMEAFGTLDPDVYDPYLAENPTYMAGMNIRQGREAFHANTNAGRVLYPRPAEAHNEILAVLADGDWVSVLLKRRAVTNKVDDYENLYGMFFEVRDGRIQTQVELLDFRVALDKFDLTALGGDYARPAGGS